MIINVSKGKMNYSQRNNELKPQESCNVTSMVMALDYLGYTFPEGYHKQPEDNLRAFMESIKLEPTVHNQLSKGVNEWMGKKVTFFSTSVPIDTLINEIMAGRPAVLSGTFPGYPNLVKNPLGHIVCLVGFEWIKNNYNEIPSAAIVDDPWGNTLANWKGSGNDIRIPWELFIKWFKPIGNPKIKWVHLFYAKKDVSSSTS
jgi:hypothetical protein